MSTRRKRSGTAVITFEDKCRRHSIGQSMVIEHVNRSVVIAPLQTPIKDIVAQDIGYLTWVEASSTSGRIEIVASLKNTAEVREALGLTPRAREAVASVAPAPIPMVAGRRMLERRRPWKLCPGCDQPMLPKGVKKKPGEFDHARGCPESRKRS